MCLDGTLGDHWPDNGVTIYYGMDDRVKAIVLDYPASFKLNGFDLSDAKIEDAISFVRSLDPQVLVGECEVYSSKLCMSVCRSVSQNSTGVSLTLDSGENDEWWF